MGCRKTLSILVVTLVFLSLLTNGMLIMFPLVRIAEAADITSWTDTNTSINVTVYSNEPVINWYDFQNSSSVSKLNQQIDVEEQYKFCINVTSDQGWANIDYINITAWYDNNSEATVYNQSGGTENLGGNLNMFLQYENETGNANWTMLWPDDEVIFYDTSCTEVNISSTTYNLTFIFKPRNQTRYAPGDGGWGGGTGYNDLKSWNFNITVDDADGYEGYADDLSNEYGYYMYTHIKQVTDNPAGTGVPGQNDIELFPHANVTTKCNANYSLYTNVTNLSRVGGGDWIENTSLSAAGGNITRTNFSGTAPLYIWGTAATYRPHLADNASDIVEITYWVNLTAPLLSGYYNGTVTYVINGDTT
jgi:hypothetical protein